MPAATNTSYKSSFESFTRSCSGFASFRGFSNCGTNFSFSGNRSFSVNGTNNGFSGNRSFSVNGTNNGFSSNLSFSPNGANNGFSAFAGFSVNGTNNGFFTNRSFSVNGTNNGFTSNLNFTPNGTNNGFSGNRSFKNFENLRPVTFSRKVTWSDIEQIYQNLNIVQNQYDMTPSTIPNYVSSEPLAVVKHATDLEDLVASLSSNTHIQTNASTAGVETPSKGVLIKTNPFEQIYGVLEKIHDNCINFKP